MADAATKLAWSLKGKQVTNANFDWGSLGGFNVRPALEFCAGIWGWIIEAGHFDAVDLSGLNIAQAARWPGPIHQGDGRLINFIDVRARDDQRACLGKIMTGKAGVGGPFGALTDLSSTIIGPRFENILITARKKDADIQIGAFAQTTGTLANYEYHSA